MNAATQPAEHNSQPTLSAQEYQGFIESFAQAFWETDDKGQVIADSPSWRAYTGQKLEAWLEAGWVEAVHPKSQMQAFRQWRQALEQQKPLNVDYQLKSPDGRWRWSNVQVRPILHSDGSVKRWLGISIDINERKRYEQQQAYLLTLTDALRSIEDPALIEATVTRLALEEFEADRCYYCRIEAGQAIITRDAMRGDMPSVAGTYPLHDFPLLEKSILEGRPFVVESAYTSSILDENIRAICLQLSVISFANIPVIKNGQALGVLCTVQSTPRRWTEEEVALAIETAERIWSAVERARAEDALRQSEEKYRLLFNSINQGFYMAEVVQDDSGKVIDFRHVEINPMIKQMTGLDALGTLVSELVPDLEDHWLEPFDRVVRTGEPWRMENYNESTGRWYEAHYALIGGLGSRLVGVTVDDTTDRKQIETSLEESKEQQAFLLSLNDTLRAASDAESIKEITVRMLGEYLHADRCYISEVFELQGFSTVGPEYLRPGVPSMAGVFQLADYPETMLELTTQPLVISDADNDPRFSDGQKVMLAKVPQRALLVAPLRKGPHRVIWTLCAAMATPRHWTSRERKLLEELAESTWVLVEKAKAEQALQESEKRLRLTIEATDLATWQWNLDTNEVHWNEQHFRLFGLEPETNPVRPKLFFEHVHPDDRERVNHLLKQSLMGEATFDTEFCALRADGSKRWMSGYGRVMQRVGNEPLLMSGVMFDITARRQAEKELFRIKERQKAILESARDYAILTLDLNSRVQDWNAGAEAVFGYAEREIVGESGDLFFVPEDRAAGVPERERVTALEQGWAENERWHVRKDGSRFYGSGITSPLLNEGGKVIGLVKVMRDLTSQRQAEDALKEADRRKNEFLAMLAHELRNPMATLRNGLQILSLTASTNAQAKSVLEMMNRQTNHLVRMVDDLLDVSRISQGKIELRKTNVSLDELVNQAAESVQALVEQKQQQLTVSLPASPVEMEGDATRLVQMVVNLLTNASRYTHPQGKIHLSLEHQGYKAILRVEDTGIGLRPDQLTSIFELFVQADNSLARSEGGLGLGLTLVKQIVELHGGTVEAQSEGLGRGSTFIVRLPTLNEEQTLSTINEEVATAPLRLLIVDDNADATFTLGMLLELNGYEVHSRNSGREGVLAAESLRPDVILLDIGMPDLNGYDTCRLIREQPWGQEVFIVAVSGYGQKEDRQRTQKAGFDGHLVKPVDLERLIQVLADLLEKG